MINLPLDISSHNDLIRLKSATIPVGCHVKQQGYNIKRYSTDASLTVQDQSAPSMLINKFTQIPLVAIALLAHCTPCSALDSVSVAAGGGNKTVVTRLGLQWDLSHVWLQNEHSHIGDYLDMTIGQWRGNRYRNMPDQTQNIIDVGVTPMLRWERNDRHGFYAEAGIGAHWLSKHYDNNGRQLSTKFEFGTRIGLGYVFQNAWDVGLMVQHLSNGGISKPNGGVNFGLVRFSRRF